MPSRESRATPPRVTPAIDARARRPRRRSPSRSTARRRAIAGIDAFRARSRRLDGRTYYTTDDARQKETASTTRASRATAFEDGGRALCLVMRVSNGLKSCSNTSLVALLAKYWLNPSPTPATDFRPGKRRREDASAAQCATRRTTERATTRASARER